MPNPRKPLIKLLLTILNSRWLNHTPCSYEFVGNVDAFSRSDIESTLRADPQMTLQEYIDIANQIQGVSNFPHWRFSDRTGRNLQLESRLEAGLMPNPNPAKQFCAICAIERNIHEHPTFIGDHSFVAKLASTEIAQSRERFEKAREDFAAPYLDLHSRSIARAAFMAGWSEAERDTRERMAQLAVQHAQDWRPCTCGFEDGKNYKTECGHAINCSMYHAINLAERIRGKV